jgi:hypothetical protein
VKELAGVRVAIVAVAILVAGTVEDIESHGDLVMKRWKRRTRILQKERCGRADRTSPAVSARAG